MWDNSQPSRRGMTPADDPVSGVFRKTKNRRGWWRCSPESCLAFQALRAVHHYVPHFEVVAQVVIMLFELRKEEFALLGNTTAGSDGELFSLLQLATRSSASPMAAGWSTAVRRRIRLCESVRYTDINRINGVPSSHGCGRRRCAAPSPSVGACWWRRCG